MSPQQPVDPKLYHHAVKMLNKKEYRKAIVDFSKYLANGLKVSKAGEAYHLRAYARYRLKNFQAAYDEWSEMPGLFPGHPKVIDGFYYMGRIHETRGNIADALQFYEQVRQSNSQNRHKKQAKRAYAALTKRAK